MSVGPPRWTSPSMCSTACWSWDARPTSALCNPGRGRGQCTRSPDPCNTAPGVNLLRELSHEGGAAPRRVAGRTIGVLSLTLGQSAGPMQEVVDQGVDRDQVLPSEYPETPLWIGSDQQVGEGHVQNLVRDPEQMPH